MSALVADAPASDPSCERCGGAGFDLASYCSSNAYRECACVARVKVEAAMPAGVRAMKGYDRIAAYSAAFKQHLAGGQATFMTAGARAKNAFVYLWFVANAVTDHARVRLISDNVLLDAYFADKRPRDDGDADGTIDSLARGPDLVVVDLNQVTSRNASASAALLSFLESRVGASRKPTWLISDPRYPWSDRSPSWSRQAESFVDTHFARPQVLNQTTEQAVEKPARRAKETSPSAREYVAKFEGSCAVCA